jgi:nucleoside-diphosphate-sugar epimerase
MVHESVPTTPLARELRASGHSVAIFHRTADRCLDEDAVRIQGDRIRLSDHLEQIQRFSPEVIIDLILSSGEQARQLMSTARKVARRVIAISSMHVHRAWGVVHQSEPGSLEPLPLTEDSPVRTNRQLYPPETMKMMQSIFSWVDERYDKIAVEEAILNSFGAAGTVLRLPMVYGRGDPLHRFFPQLKRFADGSPYSLPMISRLGGGRGDMWRTLRMRSRLLQPRTKRLGVSTMSAKNPRCRSWHGRRGSLHRHTGRESLLCCPGNERQNICCGLVTRRSI